MAPIDTETQHAEPTDRIKSVIAKSRRVAETKSRYLARSQTRRQTHPSH